MTIVTDNIAAAAQTLRNGGLVAFATETVYGLGADATSEAAVAKVFAVKGRPKFNPLITHVPAADVAFALGRINAAARRLADAFWPGPLTLVVPRVRGCPVSLLASAGLESMAIRVPNHDMALQLLTATGRPVVAPSANRSGFLSPTSASHVLKGLEGAIDMVLDGGDCRVGVESTVIDCTGETPVLLRPGGIPGADIETELGTALLSPGRGQSDAPASPGMLASHYAPKAPIRLNATEVRTGEVLLAFGPSPLPHGGPMRNLSRKADTTEAAANLFAMLHDLDDRSPTGIAVMPIPDIGLGSAINDRLRRAATR